MKPVDFRSFLFGGAIFTPELGLLLLQAGAENDGLNLHLFFFGDVLMYAESDPNWMPVIVIRFATFWRGHSNLKKTLPDMPPWTLHLGNHCHGLHRLPGDLPTGRPWRGYGRGAAWSLGGGDTHGGLTWMYQQVGDSMGEDYMGYNFNLTYGGMFRFFYITHWILKPLIPSPTEHPSRPSQHDELWEPLSWVYEIFWDKLHALGR